MATSKKKKNAKLKSRFTMSEDGDWKVFVETAGLASARLTKDTVNN